MSRTAGHGAPQILLSSKQTWPLVLVLSNVVTDTAFNPQIRSSDALGAQTLLRLWRSALHHRQLLPPSGVLGYGSRSQPVRSRAGSPAISIRSGWIRSNARALSSFN